jgi:hypothetical protein
VLSAPGDARHRHARRAGNGLSLPLRRERCSQLVELALHVGKLNPTVIQRSQLTLLLECYDQRSQETIESSLSATIGRSGPLRKNSGRGSLHDFDLPIVQVSINST